MYFHRAARLVYLAHPRTASTATSAGLLRVGFERPERGDHHAGIRCRDSPVDNGNRKEWTVFTAIRNHWDAAVSWAAQKRCAADLSPPWPLDLFEEALDLEKNSWIKQKKLWSLHLPDADVVLRYERLEEDLKHALTIAGVQMPHLGHHNISDAREDRHYSVFYDDEVRDYVGERFAGEIRELGYSFEDRREEPEMNVIDKNETCAGCDAKALRHPWVGIVQAKESEPSRFIDVPVCDDCHRDPAHRKRPLKAHFFPRAQATRAVAAAGSSSIGG